MTQRPLGLAVLIAALGGPPVIDQQVPVIRTTTYGVRLDALVTAGGQPVVGLRADDFEVLDQGVPQSIDAATAVGHVSMAVALDAGLGLRGRPSDVPLHMIGGPTDNRGFSEFFPSILGACSTLLNGIGPNDRVAIILASDRVIPLVPLTQDVTVLRQGLARTRTLPPQAFPLSTDGRGTVTFVHGDDGLMPLSSVWDAAFVAASLVARDSGRPLVIVVSDGIDDASWLSMARVARTLADVGIAVDFVQSAWRRSHPGIVTPEDVAKTTGGVVYKIDDSKLADKFKERLGYLRQSYVLTYEPRGVGTNDGWHDVVVKVKGRSATVKARPGYYANRPAK